jgi:hypothetical protein
MAAALRAFGQAEGEERARTAKERTVHTSKLGKPDQMNNDPWL